MAKGKKPHLIALQGGAGKFVPNPAAEGDVQVDDQIEPPEFMLDDNIAMGEWRRVVPLLAEKGVLDKLDTVELAIYCVCVSELHEVCLILRRDGFTHKTGGKRARNGEQLKNRPEVARRTQLIKDIRSAASSFGMNPAARIRLAMGEQDDLFEFQKRINGEK